MTEIITGGFDYGSVDDETAARLRYFADRGRSVMKRTMLQFLAEFGEILSQARDEFSQHGSGVFVSWATSEFDMSKATIYRYINAWDRCLSSGVDAYANVSPTAIYLLSDDSTPDSVRKQVAKLSRKQPTVKRSDVERLLNTQFAKTSINSQESARLASTESHGETRKSEVGEPQQVTTFENAKNETPEIEADEFFSSEQTDDAPKTTEQPAQVELNPDVDRRKCVKTVEALMRALDDLQSVRKSAYHFDAIESCKSILEALVKWY